MLMSKINKHARPLNIMTTITTFGKPISKDNPTHLEIITSKQNELSLILSSKLYSLHKIYQIKNNRDKNEALANLYYLHLFRVFIINPNKWPNFYIGPGPFIYVISRTLIILVF